MAQISAAAVKELREKSGAGMMDCKTALTESDGDMDAAVDWLRKKGLSAAAKKAGRAAAEGLVGMAVDGTRGALVEVNAETDFVARNESFQAFVSEVAQIGEGGRLRLPDGCAVFWRVLCLRCGCRVGCEDRRKHPDAPVSAAFG